MAQEIWRSLASPVNIYVAINFFLTLFKQVITSFYVASSTFQIKSNNISVSKNGYSSLFGLNFSRHLDRVKSINKPSLKLHIFYPEKVL